jgi:hypothetical protein
VRLASTTKWQLPFLGSIPREILEGEDANKPGKIN